MQELLVADLRGQRVVRKVFVQILESLVKAGYLVRKVIQPGRSEMSSTQHGAGVSNYSGHVPDQLVGCASVQAGAEFTEFGWRSAQGLLGSVGQSREEVLQDFTGLGHAQDLAISGMSARHLLSSGAQASAKHLQPDGVVAHAEDLHVAKVHGDYYLMLACGRQTEACPRQLATLSR